MIFYSKHLFKDEARKKMAKGVEELERVVSGTLGPESESVTLTRLNPVNNEMYQLGVIDDGHLAAEQVWIKDMFERAGAEFVKDAARKQATSVGDGTTATVILSAAIVKEALKVIANGENTKKIRRGLNEAATKVKAELDRMSKPIKTEKEAIQVASISASDDKDLGPKIGSLFWKIGPDGIVTVEESHDPETVIERQEGVQFDHGYLDSVFVTNPARMDATVDNTRLLLTDREIINAEDIAPIVMDLAKRGQPRIVVIAQDIKGMALEFLVDNKRRGGLQTIAIKAPSFADKQSAFLEDIAILTGGMVVSKNSGMTWDEIAEHYEDYLGTATRVTATKENTMIVTSGGKKKQIKDRVASIKAQIPLTKSDFDKEKLRERIAKLTGGAAIVRVGGLTEKEMQERKEKAVDAVAATPAAIDEGIVVGGEMALFRAREVLKKDLLDPGHRILYHALEQPLAKLLENSGYELGEFRGKLVENPKLGIDVTTGEVKDMFESGIIDPVKVPKMAVSHAVSVTSQIINTGSEITHYGEGIKDMTGANR